MGISHLLHQQQLHQENKTLHPFRPSDPTPAPSVETPEAVSSGRDRDLTLCSARIIGFQSQAKSGRLGSFQVNRKVRSGYEVELEGVRPEKDWTRSITRPGVRKGELPLPLWKAEGKNSSFLLAPYQVRRLFHKMLTILVRNLSND